MISKVGCAQISERSGGFYKNKNIDMSLEKAWYLAIYFNQQPFSDIKTIFRFIIDKFVNADVKYLISGQGGGLLYNSKNNNFGIMNLNINFNKNYQEWIANYEKIQNLNKNYRDIFDDNRTFFEL